MDSSQNWENFVSHPSGKNIVHSLGKVVSSPILVRFIVTISKSNIGTFIQKRFIVPKKILSQYTPRQTLLSGRYRHPISLPLRLRGSEIGWRPCNRHHIWLSLQDQREDQLEIYQIKYKHKKYKLNIKQKHEKYRMNIK